MTPSSKGLMPACHTPRTAAVSALTLWQATFDSRLHQRLPNTHRQVWLRLLWGHCSFLLGPDVYKVLLCPRRVSWSPVLWKFCNEILLTFKVRFPWDSQSLHQIPRLNWKSVVGPRSFATVGERLWYNRSPVCRSPTWQFQSGANAIPFKRT